MKIKIIAYSNKFNELFNQRWNFFAPPPDHNNRLYLLFYEVDIDTFLRHEFEIVEPIVLAKQRKRPFNFREEILDYSINNAIVDFNSYLDENIKLKKIEFPDSTDQYRYDKVIQSINENWFKSYPTQLLYKYALRFAEEKRISHEKHLLKIIISRLPIKKFSERNEDNKEPSEIKVFESDFLKLKNQEIINPLPIR